MRYYKYDNSNRLSSTEPSETENFFLGLSFLTVIAIIIVAWMSIVGALILITLNCGALFRNHGRKFSLCLLPGYNLYLCSKLLTGHGFVLISIIITFLLDFFRLSGQPLSGVALVLNLLSIILVAVIHFSLVGYFNRKISRLTGNDSMCKAILDCFPVISWVVMGIFLIKDMGKY